MAEYINRAALMGELTSSDMQQKIKSMTGADAYNEFLVMVTGTEKADVAEVRHGRLVETGEVLTMANERRLIDANALKAELKKSAEYHEARRLGLFSAMTHIDEQPTVDAVEVCFCKDCNWNDRDGRCMNPKCGKSWYGCPVPDEHYCSYGEKREVE